MFKIKYCLTEIGHDHFQLDLANSVYSVVNLALNFSGHALSLSTVIRTAETKNPINLLIFIIVFDVEVLFLGIKFRNRNIN